MKSLSGTERFAVLIMLAISLTPRAGVAVLSEHEELARRLALRLERGPAGLPPGRTDPLASLDRYPLTATAAYCLLGDNPNLLRSLYPHIERAVTDLFASAEAGAGGLIAGTAEASIGPGDFYSPALNALAAIELWSLHLIAWKISAYEDALEYLSWSKRLSGAVTQGFYVPERERFYPADPAGRPIALETPGELLPLILDGTLGDSARARIITSFITHIEERTASGKAAFDDSGMWADSLARPVITDLLAGIPKEGERVAAAVARATPLERAGPDRASALWIDFWRRNPAKRAGLFLRWRSYAALVNLTLLLERESLARDEEIQRFRGGIDTLGSALAEDSLSLEAFQQAIAATNRLMGRLERFKELVATSHERWRVADETKWIRLSPRTKRLVSEGATAAVDELMRTKALLADRLERGAGIAFRLDVPVEPVPKNEPVAFTAALESGAEPIRLLNAYVQIGDSRWAVIERGVSIIVGPAEPLRHTGTISFPLGADIGIQRLDASFDALTKTGRIELWRRESVVLAPPYRASISFPAGRIIRNDPVPVEIRLRFKPDHDVEGTVNGTFLREFATTPRLPARFLASAANDRTELSIAVAPKGKLSPGRYAFSLSVSLEGKSIALFEETLIRPFRWLHLGPMSSVEGTLRRANEYQADLFKTYTLDGEAGKRWREAPDRAFDAEGAICPALLYDVNDRCCLLYTTIDSPSRMKLRWSLETANSISLWINGAAVQVEPQENGVVPGGAAEFRKGSNAILIAACWNDVPDCIRFELLDEHGLPATGLGNEFEAIIDGFERLSAPLDGEDAVGGPDERLRQVTFTLDQNASEVAVIGSFNNWDPAATPMIRDASGLWRASLVLKPGRYTYKFVINRKTKIVDPANNLTEPDGFGAFNSVLEVK
jgi:hypothetical protein